MVNTKVMPMRSSSSILPLSLHPKSILVAALCSCLALSGCGGREAHPIAATNVSDTTLDCGAVQREFEANERQISTTVKERAQAQGKNIILGATGVLLFLPALFFMDPKSPEKIEIDALRNRNNVLTELAKSRRCPAPKSQLSDLYKHLDGKVDTKDSTKRD
jgi:outer membrane murein-binding lipoprotein Lpp